jgi:hypothetical protein
MEYYHTQVHPASWSIDFSFKDWQYTSLVIFARYRPSHLLSLVLGLDLLCLHRVNHDLVQVLLYCSGVPSRPVVRECAAKWEKRINFPVGASQARMKDVLGK